MKNSVLSATKSLPLRCRTESGTDPHADPWGFTGAAFSFSPGRQAADPVLTSGRLLIAEPPEESSSAAGSISV